MQALSFPFRFSKGKAVTLDTSDERYAAQKVLTAASTRLEELPLLPRFGTEDPEFDEFDSGGIYFTCATYFPEIALKDILQTDSDNGRVLVNIEFETRSEESSYGIA